MSIEVPTAQSAWTADAAAYDAWFDRSWGAYAASIEHRLLLDSLPPVAGLKVCDAGCGTGRFTERLEHDGAQVVGVDQDPASLAIAAHRVTGPLLIADVHQLPFPDADFDATFAVTVCEFTADPAATIAELVRVTKPGGHVVVGSLNRRSPWGWWNRSQFGEPPWDQARFLDRATLTRIGARHGTTSWLPGLFAPRHLPGISRWGPALERIGNRTFASWGAFGVLTIHLDTRSVRYRSGWRSSRIHGRSSPTVGWVKVALRKVL
jgi:SAM-dependent methyltransferase